MDPEGRPIRITAASSALTRTW